MMFNKAGLKRIKQYYIAYSTKNSKDKGKDLFESGAVEELILSDDKLRVEAKVEGTYTYNVELRFVGSKIRTSCNCPYDYAGICKHRVATLLAIEEYIKTNGKVSKKVGLKKRNSSTPWAIPNYSNLNLNNLSQLHKYSYVYNSYFSVNMKNVGENFLEINVSEWGDKEVVSLRFVDDVLFTSCTCRDSYHGLCPHEKATLKYILHNSSAKFLDSFRSENILKLRQDFIEQNKIPEKFDDEKNFELVINRPRIGFESFEVKPKGKLRGLLIPNYNDKVFAKRIENVTKIPTADTKSQNNALAYVLYFNPDLAAINVSQFSGKLSKNSDRLINPIDRTTDYTSNKSLFDSTDRELFKMMLVQDEHEMQNYASANYTTEEQNTIDSALEYQVENLQKLKNLLATRNFVYTTNKSNFTTFKDLDKVEVSTKNFKINFVLTENADFLTLKHQIVDENGKIFLKGSEYKYLSPLTLKTKDNVLYFSQKSSDYYILEEFENMRAGLKVMKEQFPFLYSEYLSKVEKNYPIIYKTKTVKYSEKKPEKMQKKLYVSELANSIVFKPVVEYDGSLQINILEEGNLTEYNENGVTKTIRNEELEQEFLSFMKQLHPSFIKQFNPYFFSMVFDDFVKNMWFIEAVEKLNNFDVEVFGIENLKNIKYSTKRPKFSINATSGLDWFDVEINLSFGEENISLKDIRKAIVNKQNYIKLSDGKMGLLPEEWLAKLQKFFRQGQVKKDGLKISKLHFSVIDELFSEKDNMEILKEIYEKKKRLKEFSQIEKVEVPKNLKGTLRDYQKSGLNWLGFLNEFKWGGILADDMGLGKTVQVLSFLLKIKAENKKNKTSLAVLPTTLLFNWENEIQKFAPELNYFLHYGVGREKDHKNFKNYDLVLTTYGTLTRDIDFLRKFKFRYVILDESQAIKNPTSQRFKAVSLLKAENRLAMTGTPIENNTFDLYAQMEFLNPGFLGTQKQFKDNFSNEIDKNQNPVIASELQNLINPFILRRTKEQVATELPEKTEDFVFCTMEKAQKDVYDAFRNKYRNFLLNRIEEDGLGKSKIYILEGLTKLRQICDSPLLLNEQETYTKQSVKIKELLRHIKEKTGKHKILIFSQFVKMLKLVQKELQKADIPFEYLDGKSSKKAREQSVAEFQENDDIRVFLISLKAGGTGLNLTAADYVFILDPWWNPAVENQAIDRCYRIGQEKKVIAYRMICKNTIEEKIMKLQDRKRQIATDIILTDDNFVKNLQKSDIEDLFG